MTVKAAVLASALILAAGMAWAITVDGVNDFPPAALIDADGGDTEFAPIDLLDIYVVGEAGGLCIGYGHDHDGWTGVQIGIALVVATPGGGTTDPWAHQIEFGGLCLPDYVAYVNLDSEYNEWCVWNGTDWDRTANILNWVVSTPFDEICIPWDYLGIDCFEPYFQVFMEMWVTQDSPTKGPLDLSYNDDKQLSTPEGTTWDIDVPVIIDCYHCLHFYGPSATDEVTWGGIKRLWR
jgi:hypothetical protein